MDKKIWSIYGEPNANKENNDEKDSLNTFSEEEDKTEIYNNPDIILNEYANQMYNDTDGRFSGIVTEAISEETNEVTYALYIVAQKLKNYKYRLIEVNVPNIMQPYPLEITIYAKDPRNNRSFVCDNVANFRRRLLEMITSSLTKVILMHLQNLININKEDYKFSLSDKHPNKKFKLTPPYLPITLKKILLKSHLGKPMSEWTQIFTNTSIKVTALNLNNQFKHERIISLLQFISLYQAQAVLELKLMIPEFSFYSVNKDNDCELTIELQLHDENVEFDFFYEADVELKEEI